MIIYVVLSTYFLFVLFLSINQYSLAYVNCSFRSRARNNGFLFALIGFFVMLLLASFRAPTIGNDTSGYIRVFNDISSNGIGSSARFEIGYQYYCLLLSKINCSPHQFLIITTSLIVMMMFIYIVKYSPNPALSIVLFFALGFSLSMSMIRQYIAAIFVLFAYQQIKKKKIVLPLVLIVISSLFHVSSLVSLLLFIRPKRIKWTVLVSILAVSLLLAFSGFLNGSILELLNRFNISNYNSYFASSYVGNGFLGVSLEIARGLLFLIIAFLAFRNANSDSDINGIVMNCFYLILFCIMSYSLSLLTRVSLYFLFINIVEMPTCIKKLDHKSQKTMAIILGFFCIAYFLVVLIFRPEWNRIYPYEFWS